MNKSIKDIKSNFVLQHGQSDCGVACLASIIKYHHGANPIDEIRQLSGTTKEGTSLLGLYQAAFQLGLDALGLEADSVDNLNDLSNPAILHVTLENNIQHYVVFYGFHDKKVIIGDPGCGVEFWSISRPT